MKVKYLLSYMHGGFYDCKCMDSLKNKVDYFVLYLSVLIFTKNRLFWV